MKNILEKAVKIMKENEIDHHESDLYLKVNENSKKLVEEYYFKVNVTTFVDQINNELWFDIPFAWYDIKAYEEYKKYKTQWLLDHGYTLDDVINTMQEMYEEGDHHGKKGSSPLNLFLDFEQSYGFDSVIYPCFDEWYNNEYKINKEEEKNVNTEKIGQIIGIFENFLDDKGIRLKNEQRDADNQEDPYDVRTNIYGDDYYRLEADLENLFSDDEDKNIDEIAKELYENYNSAAILKAYFISESESLFENFAKKDEKFIEKEKIGLAQYLMDTEGVFDTEALVDVMNQYLKDNELE